MIVPRFVREIACSDVYLGWLFRQRVVTGQWIGLFVSDKLFIVADPDREPAGRLSCRREDATWRQKFQFGSINSDIEMFRLENKRARPVVPDGRFELFREGYLSPQNGAGDDNLLDLGGPLANRQELCVAVVLLHRVLLDVAVSPMDLY